MTSYQLLVIGALVSFVLATLQVPYANWTALGFAFLTATLLIAHAAAPS
jgi:hypothetical protein